VKFTPVQQVGETLDRRASIRLESEWGQVSILVGGGHICGLTTRHRPDFNPLWRPPWKTIDPQRYSLAEYGEEFGSPPDGRLLAGIAGHSLSFDYFGPPSPEETAAGLSTHGEAPATMWQVFREFKEEQPGIEYGVSLPAAQIDFRRTLRLDAKHPVLYCEERARNLSRVDRPICWNEHVTIGPPFLECGATLVDMPAVQGKVVTASYSAAMKLVPDAEFQWPHAPQLGGGTHNLRTTPDGSYGRYTAQLLDRSHEIGYVAIGNARAGLLLVYLFRRSDFPWVGNWEERFYRQTRPWGGKTFCRGLEFSTTPFAVPRRQVVSEGPLFEESTFRWLSSLSEIKVHYMTLMVDIPPDFAGVERVSVDDAEVTIHERDGGRSLTIPANGSFLTETAFEQQ
jgi:hypothetical protein